MTLEQAIVEARLKAQEDFGNIQPPDLSSQGAAERHNEQMNKLFERMAEAEEIARANWVEPKKKEVKNG